MSVREVIPFGMSDGEMEMREKRIKHNCGERGLVAEREKIQRRVCPELSAFCHWYSGFARK